MSRYVVIWNRNARQGATAAEAKAELTALAGANFHETESFEQACCILDDVRDEDLVIVAGGDGGINGIVNRVQSCCQSRPTLAVVPLGTGNDFVRSLGIRPDPLSAIAAIRLGQTTNVDVIQLDHDGQTQWFINAAVGGNQRKVEQRVNDEVKKFWGPFAYIRGSLEALPEIERYSLRLTLDDAEPLPLDLWTLTIANGRTVGGGAVVAPRAKIDDGLLEVTGLQGEGLLELGSIAASFLSGDYLEHPQVFHRQASRIHLSSEKEFEFSVDGEMVVGDEFTFTTLPQAQAVIVGPEHAQVVNEQQAAFSKS